MANKIEFTIFAKDQFSNTMRGITDASKIAAKTIAVAGATIAGGMFVASKAIIDVGSQTENLKIRMNTLLGSAKEGSAVFNDMSKFASNVAFGYDEIMESATTLSGVLKGGRNEINQYMPMIADLAAVSGLTIQETTGQIVRMYSAGAGAADLFRERGITSMLGFEAGVSVSAEETKKRLIEAFESPTSKFRGASVKLASTWDGIMSMMGDKFFQFKQQIADSGIFNYFKAVAMVIDKWMGSALGDSANNTKAWSDTIIGAIESVMGGVGFLADMFHGLHAVWKGLELAFAKFAEFTLEMVYNIIDGWRQLANLIPGIDLGKLDIMGTILSEAKDRTKELGEELSTIVEAEMPSESIERFAENVRMVKTELDNVADTINENVVPALTEQMTNGLDIIETRFLEFMQGLHNNTLDFATGLVDLMESSIDTISAGIATAIVEGQSLTQAFAAIGKTILNQLLTMFIKMGVQRLVLAALSKTAVATEGASEIAKAAAATYANSFASTAAIPIIGPGLAPGVAAASTSAMLAGAGASGAAGGAVGAAVGARQRGGPVQAGASYLVGERGPEIFSPNAGGGITPNNQISGGGGAVSIEGDIVFHIMENVTNAEALLEMDDKDLKEFVAEKFIPAMDALRARGTIPEGTQ